MRIWLSRFVLILVWILATHGALDLVDRLGSESGALGTLAFLAVTLVLVWVGAHLGDVPFWRSGDTQDA